MTETEWRTSADPSAILQFVGDDASDRKLRLFACAYARTGSRLREFSRICFEDFYEGWGRRRETIDISATQGRLLALRRTSIQGDERLSFDGSPARDQVGERVVGLAERVADGDGTIEELAAFRLELDPDYRRAITGAMYCGPSAHIDYEEYDTLLATLAPTGREAAEKAIAAVSHFFVAVGDSGPRRKMNAPLRAPLKEQTLRLQCDLLREILGDPFDPPAPVVRLDPVAVAVARDLYDRRAYDELPILADALADAGADERIVGHLAGPGPHVRGCWALDLVLASEIRPAG